MVIVVHVMIITMTAGVYFNIAVFRVIHIVNGVRHQRKTLVLGAGQVHIGLPMGIPV